MRNMSNTNMYYTKGDNMANKNSNYPNNALNGLDGKEITGVTVNNLLELADKGKPKTAEELEQRIDDYMRFCCERNLRPGVESLCLSLSISRMCFWNWCNGSGLTNKNDADRWQEACLRARQIILSFIEAVSLSGRLNPACMCFLLKNWGGYQDNLQYEVISTDKIAQHTSIDDIPLFTDSIDE